MTNRRLQLTTYNLQLTTYGHVTQLDGRCKQKQKTVDMIDGKKKWITWPKGRGVCIADVLSGEWVRRNVARPAPPQQLQPPLRKILHSITTNSFFFPNLFIPSNSKMSPSSSSLPTSSPLPPHFPIAQSSCSSAIHHIPPRRCNYTAAVDNVFIEPVIPVKSIGYNGNKKKLPIVKLSNKKSKSSECWIDTR